MRNYNYPVYDDLDDFDQPVRLPKRLPEQECPRCGNQFPGGLKRCTACGLDVTRAYLVPGAAAPWPGFERGVIECNSCGYSTPDEQARRGRIQKCGQCAKVLYIPSGLYRNQQAASRFQAHPGAPKGPVWWVWDRFNAALYRFSRSKARIPVAFLIVVFGIAFLFGLNYWKAQNNKIPVAPPALKVYYDSMLNLDKTLDRYEKEFELGVGGLPTVGEFQDRLEPNNSKRFLSNTERILKQVEDDLTTVYAMQDSVPAGAEAHYAAIKTKLEERQRYYARLKDAVEQKNQDRWKAAFDGLPALRDANAKEEDALNDLQALVLKPVQITPKS